MKFNKKGQGALEYLLLIGGAVLIAVIVIALLVGMGSGSTRDTQAQATNAANATQSLAVAPIVYANNCASLAGGTDGNLSINYSGGDLTASINNGAAAGLTEPTTNGPADVLVTALCTGTGQRTVVLTATNPVTNSSASTTYTFTDSTT